MRLMGTENLKAFKEFLREAGKCGVENLDEPFDILLEAAEAHPKKSNRFIEFLHKLRCQTIAIDEACQGTKYQPIFDEHKKDMHALVENLKACKTVASKWEAIKYGIQFNAILTGRSFEIIYFIFLLSITDAILEKLNRQPFHLLNSSKT